MFLYSGPIKTPPKKTIHLLHFSETSTIFKNPYPHDMHIIENLISQRRHEYIFQVKFIFGYKTLVRNSIYFSRNDSPNHYLSGKVQLGDVCLYS